MTSHLLPQILGGDVAGIVEEAEPTSKFKKGDRVFGCTGHQEFWKPFGGWAVRKPFAFNAEHDLAVQLFPSGS